MQVSGAVQGLEVGIAFGAEKLLAVSGQQHDPPPWPSAASRSHCRRLASGGAAPFFQGAGGLIFAVSYEREKSLVTPIMIHAGGNLAMFVLTAYFSGQLF